MLKSLLPISAAIMLSGCVVHIKGPGSAPKYHDTKQLELSSADIKQLVADTGAGNLVITGDPAADKISVTAEVYAYDADDFTLTLVQRGSYAQLVASASDSNNWQVNSPGPKINLTITMPANMDLDLDDSSGSIVIEKLTGELDIEDGSGSIKVVGGGKVSIEDGSGSIHVENSQGDVDIEDGSGEISVKNVLGKVTIDDGSGSINVDGAGALEIEEAGSGGVNIHNVKGEVKVAE